MKPLIAQLMESDESEEASAVRDLLTDIRHYCVAREIDFYGALDGSYEVYLEEKMHDDMESEGGKIGRHGTTGA